MAAWVLLWLGLLLSAAACGEASSGAGDGTGDPGPEAVAAHPRGSEAEVARVDSSAPGSADAAAVAEPARAPLAGAASGGDEAEAAADERVVLCLGDSLTAGYGLEPEQAWPARLTRRAAAQGLSLRFVNGGLSGETTAAGLRRIDWLLANHPPDDVAAVIVALGGNDGLRGIPLEAMEQNLDGILERVATAAPGARLVLTGIQSPPNMGRDYTEAFAAVFPRVAARHDALLVPFLLEGVGGVPALNQPDGIHPTAAGQRLLADNVWDVLGPALEEGRAAVEAGAEGAAEAADEPAVPAAGGR